MSHRSEILTLTVSNLLKLNIPHPAENCTRDSQMHANDGQALAKSQILDIQISQNYSKNRSHFRGWATHILYVTFLHFRLLRIPKQWATPFNTCSRAAHTLRQRTYCSIYTGTLYALRIILWTSMRLQSWNVHCRSHTCFVCKFVSWTGSGCGLHGIFCNVDAHIGHRFYYAWCSLVYIDLHTFDTNTTRSRPFVHQYGEVLGVWNNQSAKEEVPMVNGYLPDVVSPALQVTTVQHEKILRYILEFTENAEDTTTGMQARAREPIIWYAFNLSGGMSAKSRTLH